MIRHFSLRAALLTLCLLTGLLPSTAKASYDLYIVAPHAGGDYSTAGVPNANGDFSGWYRDTSGNPRGYFWHEGQTTDLGSFGGSRTSGGTLIDNGKIFGDASTPDGLEHATVWETGVLSRLPEYGNNTNSNAFAANNSEIAVGRSQGGSQSGQTVWKKTNGVWTAYRPPSLVGSNYGEAWAISESGYVAGGSSLNSVSGRAVVWKPTGPTTWSVTDLGVLPGYHSSSAQGINDLGQVVGALFYGADQSFIGEPWNSWYMHAALWNPDGDGWSIAIDLGTLGGVASRAYGVGPDGTVYGESLDANGQVRGFMWDAANGMRDINDLLSSADAGLFTITRAVGANERGEIAVFGMTADGARGGILTVPEPATLSLLAFSVVGLLGRRRSKDRWARVPGGAAEGGTTRVARALQVPSMLLVACLIGLNPLTAQAGMMLYWTDDNGTIKRKPVDGSSPAEVIYQSPATYVPHALGLDPVGGQLFWQNVQLNGSSGPEHSIWRANLDGSGATRVLDLDDNTSGIHGLAVDPVNQFLYFYGTTAGNFRSIMRTTLSNPGTVEKVRDDIGDTRLIQIHDGHLYWVDGGLNLTRAALGASLGSDEIVRSDICVNGIFEVGNVSGEVYWAAKADDSDSMYRPFDPIAIWTSSLNGSAAPVAIPGDYIYPFGMDIDAADGFLYFSDWNRVRRMNLNTQVIEVVDSTGYVTRHVAIGPSEIPEPAALSLLALGGVGLLGCRRRKHGSGASRMRANTPHTIIRVLQGSVIVLIASLMIAARAEAEVVFTEDFEGYAAGSNLVGQNGWIGLLAPFPGFPVYGPPTATVTTGAYLPTQVMNGRAETGGLQQNMAEHYIGSAPAGITTLLFTAYAPSNNVHNQEVSLQTLGPELGDRASWGIDRTLGNGWRFGPGGGNGNIFVAGGFDQPVRLGIVLDGIEDEVYGLYDFGSGFIETPHYGISETRLTALDAVHIYIDHRAEYDRGIEVDNISVSQVIPEPAALSLLALGGVGLLGRRRGRPLLTNHAIRNLALAVVGGLGLGISASAHAQDYPAWSRQFGTSSDDWGTGVAVDAAGNAWITGSTYGGLDGPNLGLGDAFLTKYDASGNVAWTSQMGTSELDGTHGVAIDAAGNAYITGGTNGSLGGPFGGSSGLADAFLSKVDSAGNLAWSRQMGTNTYDKGYDVAVDSAGNAYMTGATGGVSTGYYDAFLTKYNGSGNVIWTRQIGTSGSSNDRSGAVAVDAAGNVYITGHTEGDLGGPNAGIDDVFVSKFDIAGNLVWTKQIGSTGYEYGAGIAVDDTGNVYISGQTKGSLAGPNAGGYDAFLIRLDSSGNLNWAQQFGTSTDDISYGVALDGLGNAYINGWTGGSLFGPSAGGNDAFLAMFDNTGNLTWMTQFGTSGDDWGINVTVDSVGNPWITGYTSGSLFGPNAGGDDAFIAMFSVPEPTSLSLLALGGVGLLIRRRTRRSLAVNAGVCQGCRLQRRARATCRVARPLGALPAICLVPMLVTPTLAAWTVTNLHPEGATRSNASAIYGGRQGGFATFGGSSHATVWTGTASSAVDLHPAGVVHSYISALSADQEGGAVNPTGVYNAYHASFWSGTASSVVDLHPSGSPQSTITDIQGTRQFGWADFGGPQASVWLGTTASRVQPSLPAGAFQSSIEGVNQTSMAGAAMFASGNHAMLWANDGASFVDLHPNGALHSTAYDLYDDQQAGVAHVDGFDDMRASLWTGTSESWTDLHPVGATKSAASSVHNEIQTGWAIIEGNYHASLWRGTADSWQDLSLSLPNTWTYSIAMEVWTDSESVYVAGYGMNSITGREEALLWTQIVPEPASLSLLALASVGLLGRRRTRRLFAVNAGDCQGYRGKRRARATRRCLLTALIAPAIGASMMSQTASGALVNIGDSAVVVMDSRINGDPRHPNTPHDPSPVLLDVTAGTYQLDILSNPPFTAWTNNAPAHNSYRTGGFTVLDAASLSGLFGLGNQGLGATQAEAFANTLTTEFRFEVPQLDFCRFCGVIYERFHQSKDRTPADIRG